MTITTRRGHGRRLPAFLLALLGGVVAAPVSAAAADVPMPLVLEVSGESLPGQNRLHAVGADGEITYGTIRLTGSTMIGSTEVDVEIVGNAVYVDGSGPFSGALTIRYPSGDELGLRYEAIVLASEAETTITGSVVTLGGTGVLEGVTGDGSVIAVRTGPLGSAVTYTMTLDLPGLPDPAESPATTDSILSDPDAPAIDLMTAYSDMLVAKDLDGLDDLLSDAFQIQRADGSHATKDEYLGQLPDLTAFAFEDAVEARAGDVATLRMLAAAELTIDGAPYRPDPAPMLAVFQWAGDGWQLVAQGNFNLPR